MTTDVLTYWRSDVIRYTRGSENIYGFVLAVGWREKNSFFLLFFLSETAFFFFFFFWRAAAREMPTPPKIHLKINFKSISSLITFWPYSSSVFDFPVTCFHRLWLPIAFPFESSAFLSILRLRRRRNFSPKNLRIILNLSLSRESLERELNSNTGITDKDLGLFRAFSRRPRPRETDRESGFYVIWGSRQKL